MRHTLRLIGLAPMLLLGTAFHACALEIDEETELLLNCGTTFIIASENEKQPTSQTDALKSFGATLLAKAEANLVEQGATGEDLKRIGEEHTVGIATALGDGEDPGFEAEQCAALLLDHVPPEAAPVDFDRITPEMDLVLTCGAGFFVTSSQLRRDGEEEDADMLLDFAGVLLERSESMLIAAGYDEEMRDLIGSTYGRRVAMTIGDGKDLSYSWDKCTEAAIGMAAPDDPAPSKSAGIVARS